MDLPKRKKMRLENYCYGEQGTYFITMCVQNREQLLSKIIVGTGVLDCPKIQLLYHGEIANKYINQLNDFYEDVFVDKYVIMPDHIHLILRLQGGQSRTPVPTVNNTNSTVARFVSTFKRFCNNEYGRNIWQPRYYDHVIRNQNDYNDIWEYIDNNPRKRQMKHGG